MPKINRIYIALFLISLASLMLEVSLIRFFSVIHYYHFAFMIISIALFGIAASGTFMFIKELKKPLFPSSLLFSITTVLGFLITNNLFFDPYKILINPLHIFVLVFYYIFLSLPFFFFGIIVTFIFYKNQKDSSTVYFYNLVGSAFGVILTLPLLAFLNIKIIFLISLFGLFASLFFINTDKIKKIILFLIIVNLLLFLLKIDINVSLYKDLSQALSVPNSKLIATKWNAYSRVDIVNSSFARYAPGLSLHYTKDLPAQIGVFIDGSNMNSITKYDDVDFTEHLPMSLPYYLIDKPRVLVINAGAGLDVLTALKHNATVTALDTNGIILNLLKDGYKEFSGNIYNRAKVYFGEGRNFIKKNKEYDVIVLSLSGNILAGPSGITSLAENYLLTVDAFNDYFNSLSDNGILVITRWLYIPPKEELRLFSLALEIDNSGKKTAMINSWNTVTLLLSKKDLNKKIVDDIKAFTNKNGFDIIYLPKQFNFEPNKYSKFKEAYHYNAVQQLLKDRERFYKNYLFDVSPVYDDKPYYFNFFRLSKFFALQKILGQRWNPFLDSGFLLFFIFIQALILATLFICIPLAFKKKIKRIKNKKSLFYFFAIGIAFLFIEIVLIQKFTLFLGHSIFSTTIVIFSMLLFSSLGSLYSQRTGIKNLRKIIFILFLLIIVYSFLFKFFINKFITLNLVLKIILTSIFIAPLSFLMGFAFPLGIKKINKKLIPWAWAVNGSASVLSPILAIMIAVFFGYTVVFVLAGFSYLLSIRFIEQFNGKL
ncbi:hypothetical protein HYW99_01615 [Candidatus Woesearchaeota archaeon]|nr:hypothetical protein [Candidatus Woesearchaeota archaeon]